MTKADNGCTIGTEQALVSATTADSATAVTHLVLWATAPWDPVARMPAEQAYLDFYCVLIA